MGKSVAGAVSGRRIKYVFVIFWLAVAAFAGPLAGKLTDVERNDTKSWLPGGAESVQVIDVQSSFASPNTIPAIIVYERPSGLTEADQAKMRADAAAFGSLAELDGTVTGPI